MVGYNPSQFRQIIQKQLVIKERQKQNSRLGDYQKKFRLGVGIRGNNQRHYRDQTGMIC
jgi:transposase